VHPVAVQGYGGKNFYGIKGVGPKDKWDDNREIDDQIFVTFEFPGEHYEEDQDDKCVVTYSSMSTNRFEPYGESVYGSRATLIMKAEKDALLYKEASAVTGGGGPDQRLWVVNSSKEGGPVLEAYETTTSAAATAKQASPDDVSRGYREEMEHLCWAIRNQGDYYPGGQPVAPKDGGIRCNGNVAMADAIMAITANLAMKHKQRIEFREEWFDPNNPATPEDDIAKQFGGVA